MQNVSAQPVMTRTVCCRPQALIVRTREVLALHDGSANKGTQAYTIPAVRVRSDGTEQQAAGATTSAKTKGASRGSHLASHRQHLSNTPASQGRRVMQSLRIGCSL